MRSGVWAPVVFTGDARRTSTLSPTSNPLFVHSQQKNPQKTSRGISQSFFPQRISLPTTPSAPPSPSTSSPHPHTPNPLPRESPRQSASPAPPVVSAASRYKSPS